MALRVYSGSKPVLGIETRRFEDTFLFIWIVADLIRDFRFCIFLAERVKPACRIFRENGISLAEHYWDRFAVNDQIWARERNHLSKIVAVMSFHTLCLIFAFSGTGRTRLLGNTRKASYLYGRQG
jgi:hypothetical protein